MKLCKDCKHVSTPNPMLQLQMVRCGSPIETRPMCLHPKAAHSPVFGQSVETCLDARSSSGCCGADGALFEEKPAPEPAPDAGSIVYAQPQEDIKRGWFARLFGR